MYNEMTIITTQFRILSHSGALRVRPRASGRFPWRPRPSCGASCTLAASPPPFSGNWEARRAALRRRPPTEAPPKTTAAAFCPSNLPPSVAVRERRSSCAPPQALSRRTRLFLGSLHRHRRRRRNAHRGTCHSLPIFPPPDPECCLAWRWRPPSSCWTR